MGSQNTKYIWVEKKVETWVAGVKCLSGFSGSFTWMSYDDLNFSLQRDCHFFHNVIHGVVTLCAPLEVETRHKLLPEPMGYRRDEVDYEPHKSTTWGVQREGIGIPEPTQTHPIALRNKIIAMRFSPPPCPIGRFWI